MAELSTAEKIGVEGSDSSCCSPEAHATCCEPSAKADCCGDTHAEGCGCEAGKTSEAPTGDIREQVRERHAAAAT